MSGSDKVNVLLISANSETIPAPVYPLGMARLAWALDHAGYTARQFDVLVHGRETLRAVLSETLPDLIAISMRNVDNLQSGESRSYVQAYRELIQEVRNHTASPVVIGGSGFSLFPRELMRVLNPDFGVIGPGEAAICDLRRAIGDGRGFQHIPNVLWAEGGSDGGGPALAHDAAALHDPAILRHYWANGGMIGFQTKRGCPLGCSYCTYPLIDGGDVSAAEPAELVDAIEKMVADFGINYLFIVDSVFNLYPEHEVLFAEELCKRALGVSWSAFFRPSGMDRNYLMLLKRSGLTHIEFGTDSLCDRMLLSYCKGFTVDDVHAVSLLSAELGVFQAHYLLLGGPGETTQTIQETLRNAAKLTNAVFLPFAGLRIYPRTGLYRTALEEGMIAPGMDCLTPTFYIAPGLDASSIWKVVAGQSNGSNRWILPGGYRSLMTVMSRMRRRGMKGPLWEYAIQ